MKLKKIDTSNLVKLRNYSNSHIQEMYYQSKAFHELSLYRQRLYAERITHTIIQTSMLTCVE